LRIPDVTPIAGIEYETQYEKVDEEGLLHEKSMARIFFQIAKIVIRENGLDHKVMERSYVHEALHGIFCAMAVDEREVYINEDFVDRMSYYMHQVIDSIVEYNLEEDSDLIKPTTIPRKTHQRFIEHKKNYR